MGEVLMPIDPRISMGVNPLQVQMPDPNQGMNALARALQIKNAMSEGDMNALKMDEYKRGIADQNVLNEVYKGALRPDGTLDQPALLRAVAERNQGSKIPGLQKSFADADKSRNDAFKAAGENYKAFQLELGSEFNNPNLSKQTVAQRIAMRVQAGAMDGGLGSRMLSMLPDDPQQLRGALRQIVTSQMTPEQMFTAFAPKATQIDSGGQIGFRDTNPNSPTYGQATGGAPVQKVATPGDLLASQDRAKARAQSEQHFNATQAQGKVPAGYRQKPDGTLEFIPGGPADPARTGELKMTEDQGKATGWLVQAENAYKNMLTSGFGRNASGKVVVKDAARPGINDALEKVPFVGGLANSLRSADRQKFMQASSSLSEALLRAATGAGVNADEARQKIQELTPRFGEDATVTQQKMDAIPLYIETLKVRSGPGAKRAQAITGAQTGGATGDFGDDPLGLRK